MPIQNIRDGVFKFTWNQGKVSFNKAWVCAYPSEHRQGTAAAIMLL
jgi:hypothetical protein